MEPGIRVLLCYTNDNKNITTGVTGGYTHCSVVSFVSER